MVIEIHNINDKKIAEVISNEIIINTTEDGIDLLGNIYYQGIDRIVLNQKNITPDFFDLKNGIAGEILQKFSTYRVRLTIVGDFSKYNSKSLADFIYESNKGRQINFVNSTTEALKTISNWKFQVNIMTLPEIAKAFSKWEFEETYKFISNNAIWIVVEEDTFKGR